MKPTQNKMVKCSCCDEKINKDLDRYVIAELFNAAGLHLKTQYYCEDCIHILGVQFSEEDD